MRYLMLSLFLLPMTVCAQSIEPIHNECSRKCSDSFWITNTGLAPLTFTIESYQLAIKDHQPVQVPLDSRIIIKLSETSGRLAPKERRQIDVKILNDVPEATAVTILTGFMPVQHVTSGIAVRIILPHEIYFSGLNQKLKGTRERFLTAASIPTVK